MLNVLRSSLSRSPGREEGREGGREGKRRKRERGKEEKTGVSGNIKLSVNVLMVLARLKGFVTYSVSFG